MRSYDIRGIDAADSELRLVGDGGATRGMVELRRARGGFVAELAPAGGAASLTLRAEGESWSAGDGNGAAVDLAAASPAQSAAFALLVAVLADEAVQGKFPLVSRGEAIYVSCGNACSGCGTCAGAPADLHAAACNACAPCFTCVEAAAP